MPHDPHDTPDARLFECVQCGERVETDSQPLRCAVCDGELRDISVPREQ